MTPALYLSVASPSPGALREWTVILNGSPLMRPTFQDALAREFYRDARRSRRCVDPETPPVWDGDLGRFTYGRSS